jgi:hypothetical protein
VLGGIQPEKLSECLLSGSDDGLAARFFWAWPDAKEFGRPTTFADKDALEDIYRRLDGIKWGCGRDGERDAITLPLDPNAVELFIKWGRGNDTGIEDSGALYKGFCGKLKGGVLRLALVVEYLNWAINGGDEPTTISTATLGKVCAFVDDYAKPTALRVFGDAALPPVERNTATLARHIRRAGLSRVNARELKRGAKLPGMREAAPLNDAIASLIEANWLRPRGVRAGETAGRASSDFIVNPLALGELS